MKHTREISIEDVMEKFSISGQRIDSKLKRGQKGTYLIITTKED